jgi:peptide/nickel transport system substrate-binding protein
MSSQFKRYSILDKFFNLIEKQRPGDRLLLRGLFFVALFAAILFLYNLNKEHSFATPTRGGVLIEGIVGIPRFVNPALAITRADQDAVALIYSGLLKIGNNGELEPDIAENISVSEDGTEYTITVRKDRKFHDGTPITASDAIYTIKLIQNPDLKSPLRGNWNDVEITEVSEYEFKVILREAYYPFIENFTLGIMPKHIWSNLPIEQLPFSQWNTEPIGSGQFSIEKVNRDDTKSISGYLLKPETNNQNNPNLAGIELKFFQNESDLVSAFKEKTINSTAYLPTEEINKLNQNETKIITEPLPRIFGIFFNQNRSAALRDKAARQALNVSINRINLISEAINGFGVPITKPILTSSDKIESNSTEDIKTSLEQAKEILIAGGWKQNGSGLWEKSIDKNTETLSLTIKTSNSAFFDKTANLIADEWRKLGVEVQVDEYEQTGLVQSVIRSRDFQALLFGLDMNRTQDLYPFWHSSQKSDPGLNISQYTNIAVDRLLEKTRNSQNKEERDALLLEISEAIDAENPAIMLFAPSIVYVVDKNIIPTPMTNIGKPSDRFMNVSNWYAKSEIIWPIFQKKEVEKNININ